MFCLFFIHNFSDYSKICEIHYFWGSVIRCYRGSTLHVSFSKYSAFSVYWVFILTALRYIFYVIYLFFIFISLFLLSIIYLFIFYSLAWRKGIGGKVVQDGFLYHLVPGLQVTQSSRALWKEFPFEELNLNFGVTKGWRVTKHMTDVLNISRLVVEGSFLSCNWATGGYKKPRCNTRRCSTG